MIEYCKNYKRQDEIITQITIPANKLKKVKHYVIQMVLLYKGKNTLITNDPDGAIIIKTTFENEDNRKLFCEKVNKAIHS